MSVQPKTLSPTDPAARFTDANGDRPYFAYSTNHLVDLEHAIIVDVEDEADLKSFRWIDFPPNAPIAISDWQSSVRKIEDLEDLIWPKAL